MAHNLLDSVELISRMQRVVAAPAKTVQFKATPKSHMQVRRRNRTENASTHLICIGAFAIATATNRPNNTRAGRQMRSNHMPKVCLIENIGDL